MVCCRLTREQGAGGARRAVCRPLGSSLSLTGQVPLPPRLALSRIAPGSRRFFSCASEKTNCRPGRGKSGGARRSSVRGGPHRPGPWLPREALGPHFRYLARQARRLLARSPPSALGWDPPSRLAGTWVPISALPFVATRAETDYVISVCPNSSSVKWGYRSHPRGIVERNK